MICSFHHQSVFLGASFISPENDLFSKEIDALFVLISSQCLKSTSWSIFLDPSRQIFWHICRSGEPGILARFSLRFFETAPSPPITTGITSALPPHIRSASTRNAPYFAIFSASFLLTLVSTGHEISIIYVFLLLMSLIRISGLFAPTGLVVKMVWSYAISVLFL